MRVDVGLRFTGGALAGLRQDLLAVLNDTRKEQCEKGAADDDVGLAAMYITTMVTGSLYLAHMVRSYGIR